MSEDTDRAQKLAELQGQLDAIQTEQGELAVQIAAMPTKYDGSTVLPTDHTASQATVDEVERAQVVRDPWAGQNALQILRHPPGKRLQWIHEMIGNLGLPAMIDTGQDKAESKNWSQAFEALKTIIAPSNHPDQK